jgi:hypothetical protein
MKDKDIERVRRQHLAVRQTAIFGGLIAVLVVAGVAGVATLTGRMESPFEAPFSSATPTQVDYGPVPCPETSTSKYPAAAAVRVRPLNGSDIRLAASTAGQTLEARGFQVLAAGNASVNYGGSALVVAGKNGVDKAYLLLAHAPADAELAFDDRADDSVDLITGAQWDGLRPVDEVTAKTGALIPSPEGCEPVAELAAQIQATGTAAQAAGTTSPSATPASPSASR